MPVNLAVLAVYSLTCLLITTYLSGEPHSSCFWTAYSRSHPLPHCSLDMSIQIPVLQEKQLQSSTLGLPCDLEAMSRCAILGFNKIDSLKMILLKVYRDPDSHPST